MVRMFRSSAPPCAALACAVWLLVSLPPALRAAESDTVAGDVATAVPERLAGWMGGLTLLHSSRTDAALSWFLERRRQSPDDVCAFYFPALVYLNFNVEGLDARARSERGRQLLDQGIRVGERLYDAGRADIAARYCLGALHGLRAQVKLETRSYVGAARAAKRSRRLMLHLLEDEPDFVDCRFWLGSYDYFADVLPGYVKFFRALLFIPGGDRERGLAALLETAREGSLDRFNALWTLHEIHSSFERDEQKAREAARRLHAAYPESVDATLALARHYASGRSPDRAGAIDLHRQCLERLEVDGADFSERVIEKVKLSLARIHAADLDPAPAIELARGVWTGARGHKQRELPAANALVSSLIRSGEHAEAVTILRELKQRYAADDLEFLERQIQRFDDASSKVHQASLAPRRLGRRGRLAEAEAAFTELLAEHGERAQIYYWIAETHFEQERLDEAALDYGKAAAIDDVFPTFLPAQAWLRLGNVRDLKGNRRGAKKSYEHALKTADEESLRRAAKYFLKHPFKW